MAIINSYPTVTPTSGDLVLIVDTSVEGNPTKTATISSLQSESFNQSFSNLPTYAGNASALEAGLTFGEPYVLENTGTVKVVIREKEG